VVPSVFLFIFSLTGCRSAPLAVPDNTHVVLIRGFHDWYSAGVDQLADEIRASGRSAWSIAEADHQKVGDALLRSTPSPLVLIGFSYGADDAVGLAQRLDRAGKRVDLLITIDPVTPPAVPDNIVACVNYYQSNGIDDLFPWLRGIPLHAAPGTAKERIVNFDLRTNRRDLLQPDTSHATIAAHEKLHQEIVARVIETVPADTLPRLKP
jgi:pimeloyl-ACP methyl ester carboxylesterase